MSYQYGATKQVEDKLTALRRREAALVEALQQVRGLIEAEAPKQSFGCGTNAGYMRRKRRREEPCESCKLAHAEYQAEYRGSKFERRLHPCGTAGAYRRHLRKGEEPCEPCKIARRIDQRNYRAQKAIGAPTESPRTRQNAA